ncbi:MAG TPA: hypothetical protein GXX24_04545 [Paracoccus solventivorans]|uniref:Uncharacterized protein n=1 Tax=Paracoccus solventivorans TaxID=53463 RepID=A0A832PMP4_9RHOB|nr:hypothetical protein [Paracoccus solventivorans]HHW33400.1 hypothetical protein [Paracoccus solventivorans]
MSPKYPQVTVHLTDLDGNAFAILARCRRAAEIAHLSPDQIDQFLTEATEGDYDHLLQTAMRWFEIT